MIEELDASHVNQQEIPYFDYAPGVQMKLLKINRVTGQITMLLKAEPGAELGRHKHYGIVHVYTLGGKWRYKEDHWVAVEGSYIFEPAGSIHTFEADQKLGLLAFIVMDGSLEYLDENNNTLAVDNWQSLLQKQNDYCVKHNLPVPNITKF